MIGHVIDVNPAHAVRGPKYVVKKGKTPVLTAEEARELLNSIRIVRNTARDGQPESEEPALVGLRDRALIAVMVYSFARINAVLEMKVRDYFVQGRRGWVRLHEKGGKEHEVPCHHKLEQYLDEYIAAAGLAGDPNLVVNTKALANLGIPITEHDKLPDVVLHDRTRRWLFLIEAVTSHGPVSPKRIVELEKMFAECPAGLVYVSAFPDMAEFKRHAPQIAWETEMWLAEVPDHLIHFNGDRFFGPRTRN